MVICAHRAHYPLFALFTSLHDTHLVQLLLVDVIVVVRLRRHRSMLPPHGIEGVHEAGDIGPLSKVWSNPMLTEMILNTGKT
jgi:hypothetical protein